MAKAPKIQVEETPAEVQPPEPIQRPTDPAVASFLEKVEKRMGTLENDLVARMASKDTVDKQRGDLEALAAFIMDNSTLSMTDLKAKAGEGTMPAPTSAFSLSDWVNLFVPDVFGGIGELIGFAAKAAPKGDDK